jgi:hypothetical protein
MKIMSFLQYITEKGALPGTYSAATFDKYSTEVIVKYMYDNKIVNALSPDKLHVTLMYSRKHCVDFNEPDKLKEPLTVFVKGFDIWPTRGQKQMNALVARLESPGMITRHNNLMNKYDGSFDFTEYKPHFTLSYDVGDLDAMALPPLTEPLKLIAEFSNELNPNWVKEELENN